ncbi:MAG TPA: prenyltransferase/squalene oxidase repeat-containing protein [Solirubrobacterales bacterium]|nr:prenyltransferase/squalene oxidase repeat-containing protein [Solirubrobacterales bacterium]
MRLLVLIGMTVLALAASAVAAARTATQQAFIDKTVRFLQESQQIGGGFAEPGRSATQITTSWAVQALEGAGINPQDQARCGTDAYTFLVDHFQEGLEEELSWPQVPTTAFERELLVVDGAGTDPHDFAGHDLVSEILRRRLADGSFPYTEEGTVGESNDTIFAILALSPIHEPAIEAVVDKAAEWVVGAENEDGGWYYSGRTASSEVDMTGAALQALAAAGPPSDPTALAAYEAAIHGGLEYLKRAQLPDGGFPALPTQQGESNVASTAWAVQGIWATGGNPETWTVPPEGKEPLGYMESMQQPDGHIRWKAAEDVNGIWMTAYVLPAFSGQVIPPPPAARGSGLASHGEAANCVEAGQGGEAKKEGEGVLAGGGGHRAPAFSRPRRGSKGKTPGGARVVRGEGLDARDHSARRRGSNLHQATGTETAEPRSAAEADQEAESVRGDTSAAGAASGAGGGGDDGRPGPGARGTRITRAEAPPGAATTTGEEVSGVVIGSPTGTAGKLAFGAPGLRSAGAGSGEGPGAAIAIGIAAVLAVGLGVAWERHRGVLA